MAAAMGTGTSPSSSTLAPPPPSTLARTSPPPSTLDSSWTSPPPSIPCPMRGGGAPQMCGGSAPQMRGGGGGDAAADGEPEMRADGGGGAPSNPNKSSLVPSIMKQLLYSAPTVLVVDPERILRPKLDFFASLGFEPRKLATAPVLLRRGLDKHLIPCIQFLRDIIGSDDALRQAFHRKPHGLTMGLEANLRPAVEALRRAGLNEAAISKLLVIQLDVLAMSPDRISKVFEDLKEIGMSIADSRFLYCFGAMCAVKRETWLRKLALYRSFGLSEIDVFNAFKTLSTILLLAEESIKKKVRFFLDELKLGIHDVIAQPVILGYSLEKCILPRCAVLSVLMREGRVQRDIKLIPALLGTSRVFSTKYVLRHADDLPDIVKAYEGKIKFEGFGCDR